MAMKLGGQISAISQACLPGQALIAGSICLDCLKLYKQEREGKPARLAGGAWGKGRWPASCRSDSTGKRCLKKE